MPSRSQASQVSATRSHAQYTQKPFQSQMFFIVSMCQVNVGQNILQQKTLYLSKSDYATFSFRPATHPDAHPRPLGEERR